ncbi:MAG: hypothetical protein M3R41_10995 [Pseudomonadota bacterium]|nr:hypothetical protein [Pseudomonadota bacterium]
MADSPHFYRLRAAEERANADAAVLDNVRDRCDRAARAWEAMAERHDRTLQMRLDREAAVTHRIPSEDVSGDAVSENEMRVAEPVD